MPSRQTHTFCAHFCMSDLIQCNWQGTHGLAMQCYATPRHAVLLYFFVNLFTCFFVLTLNGHFPRL